MYIEFSSVKKNDLKMGLEIYLHYPTLKIIYIYILMLRN